MHLSKAYHILLLFAVFLFSEINLSAQNEKPKRVKYQAAYSDFNKKIGNGAQRLIDNVVFTHEGAKMYCDSAYYFSKTNSLDAFSNVYINQGDTLHLYGDFLHYEGNTRLAEITGREVKLINQDIELTTDKLDFDLGSNIGYYTTFSTIVNKENTLTSFVGHYYANKKTFHFRDSVVIVTPDYVVTSDTLHYHSKTGVADFMGPTEIVGDSSYIYCERGWYDTKKKLTEARQNAWADNFKQIIKGEYIFFDQNTGDGIARNEVEIFDKEQNILLTGNDGKYNKETEYAFMTDSAQFIQISEEDSLFLHADSILTYVDTTGEKILFAYYDVKFYRIDLQGMCDSIVYTFIDSTSYLFGTPVLWTENKQVSANRIDVFTKNKLMERMDLVGNSFMISHKDIYFDQMKGKNMNCFFKENQLQKIDVNGNGQVVYYAEDGPDIVGVNKVDCTNMSIFFENGKQIKKMNFYVNPVGVLYPLDQAPENELRLKGFNWLDSERPKSKFDIFK
jgi:lipopolysaccharide export system protein LptA